MSEASKKSLRQAQDKPFQQAQDRPIRQTRGESIRVRIAPSPTGPLHLGTARTALFNWLFAKREGGKFILRIEDTDLERSDIKFENDILDNLKWLGLEWDEFYKQSERLDIYEKHIRRLSEEKKAYYCFCSKEELEEHRQAQLAQGLAPRYIGRCRNMEAGEAEKRLKEGRPAIIRFKVPEVEIVFKDLIRGQVKFDAALFGDVAIAKDLRSPLYNLAAVIDDETTGITHVIRGEDHLSNTPKQILIQLAFGFRQPVYAHLPLILDPDRRKLSKRFAAIAVQEYRNAGYLPGALINFLVLLGWHPKEDREFLTVEELIKEFSLSRVQKAGAVFNSEKLDWLNAQHIRKMTPEQIAENLTPYLKERKWDRNKALLVKIIELERERIKKLSDFVQLAGFFFELPEYDTRLLVWRDSPVERIADNLKTIKTALEKIEEKNFKKAVLEEAVNPVIDAADRGVWLWPLRAALSGLSASPGPFEIMEVLGKEEALRRLDIAVKKLEPEKR